MSCRPSRFLNSDTSIVSAAALIPAPGARCRFPAPSGSAMLRIRMCSRPTRWRGLVRPQRAEWVDGRVTAGHQSANGNNRQFLVARQPRGRQDGPSGPQPASALHLGGAAASRVSAALQSMRAVSRSAITWTTRFARSPARRTGSAPTSRPHSFSPGPTSTKAASSSSRTPTACTA